MHSVGKSFECHCGLNMCRWYTVRASELCLKEEKITVFERLTMLCVLSFQNNFKSIDVVFL